MSIRHRRGILVVSLWAVNAIGCSTYVPRDQRRLVPERQTESWTSYLGTPRHDVSAGESLAADPRPLWRTDVGRVIRGSPAIAESVLAVGVAERYVVLLERATGRVLWRSRLQGTIHGGPLLDRDRVYVATQTNPEGKVYSLRLKTGRVLWSTTVGSVEAPLGADSEALYLGTEGGLILRVDRESGRVAWRRRVTGAIRAAPVPTRHGLVVATTNDSLYLLDPRSGEIQRRSGTDGSILGAPALDGDRMFLGTASGHLQEIELPSLAVRWDRAAGDAVFGAPALAGDTLYAVARNGTLWIIPTGDPTAARSVPLDLVVTAGPTPIASGILVAGVNGAVLLVERATGAVRWRTHVTGPVEQPPLVRNGTLVVIAGRGDIHAYR